MQVIGRNLFKVLSAGAFGIYEQTEPMSLYKWQSLLVLAEQNNTIEYTVIGMKELVERGLLHLPQAITDDIAGRDTTFSPITIDSLTPQDLRLRNIFLNRRLESIRRAEKQSIETSITTMQMLDLLIYNIGLTFREGISISGVIQIGVFLRTIGDKVDFVKLDDWIDALKMRRMSCVFGTILVELFRFDEDEIPFMTNYVKSGIKLISLSLDNAIEDNAEDKYQAEHTMTTGTSTSQRERRLGQRNWRYLRYHPTETISNVLGNLKKSITSIDE